MSKREFESLSVAGHGVYKFSQELLKALDVGDTVMADLYLVSHLYLVINLGACKPGDRGVYAKSDHTL